MATVRGSEINPSIVDNDMERLELRKEKNRNEKVMDELAARKSSWDKFKITPQGMTLLEIADPEIKYYEEMLSRPTNKLMMLGDLPLIESARAEWRGCLSVWKSIKFNMKEYEEKLAEMEAMTKKEETERENIKKAKLQNYR